MKITQKDNGFALTELLIIIAASLALVVISLVAVNPAKLMQNARDNQRFKDIVGLKNAVNLYLADNNDFGTLEGPYYSNDVTFSDDKTRSLNNGKGWLPVNFTKVSTGASIKALPLDPLNNEINFYSMAISRQHKTYEINLHFEKTENIKKEITDGGNNPNRYELGTDLTILP